MEKKNFLIVGAGTAFLVVIILIALLFSQEGGINIITDRNEYKLGDILKVKIENNSRKSVCFSSCYPYFFERKNGEWDSYRYIDCANENLTKNCVSPKQIKAFEITISFAPIKEGPHRIAIPACIGCNFDEAFREDKRFYSNDFNIK